MRLELISLPSMEIDENFDVVLLYAGTRRVTMSPRESSLTSDLHTRDEESATHKGNVVKTRDNLITSLVDAHAQNAIKNCVTLERLEAAEIEIRTFPVNYQINLIEMKAALR